MDDAKFVSALRGELIARLGAGRYELWFASQAQMCVESGRLVVSAANSFVRDWLQRNFSDDLAACAAAVAGGPLAVEFEVGAAKTNECGVRSAECGVKSLKSTGPAAAAQTILPMSVSTLAASSLNPQSVARPSSPQETRNPKPISEPAQVAPQRSASPTLSQFATGASNEYAFRSAELTAHGLQQASPIVFCGPTGVGKTHLLRAIQAEYRRRHPRAAAVYLTAEQFTTSFVEALRGSGLPSFRQKCRGAELLLVDDLQFFAGKQRTVEELHHTVDTLVTAGKQLVLASDRNLAGLRTLGPELSSRLAGGLICEIAPPEFATRFKIARQLRDEMHLAADDEILSLVATQISAGARELRGALHRLHAVCTAGQQPLTRELAESAIADLVRQSTRSVRLADVEQAVCDVFGVESASLRSDRKGRTQAEPRMLAMWLARKYTRAPWSEIGEFFGRRSHSTVISAHRRVEQLITTHAKIGVGDSPCNVEEAIRRLETALRTA